MAYMMENVNILKDGQLNRTSLLVEQRRISLIRPSMKNYQFMKMDGDSFIMTASHVTLDTQIPIHLPFHQQKEYYIHQFIRKGCTTFLTYVEIKYEFELQSKLKQLKKDLLNSPIDYVIGIKIPIHLLTASFMRQCKQSKIPAIFVEINNKDELFHLPWGWIKEAMFPYNSPLIPIFSGINNSDEMKQAKNNWKKITYKEKVSCMTDELMEKQPISKQHLAKIGIYPIKASIHQGAEVSYNFYEKSREINKLDVRELFGQYENRLLVTVHKGTVIRAGEQINFQPGFGEYIKINTPSFYTIDDTWRGS